MNNHYENTKPTRNSNAEDDMVGRSSEDATRSLNFAKRKMCL